MFNYQSKNARSWKQALSFSTKVGKIGLVYLKEGFATYILQVKRASDSVMSLELETEGVMLSPASGHAPQVG